MCESAELSPIYIKFALNLEKIIAFGIVK